MRVGLRPIPVGAVTRVVGMRIAMAQISSTADPSVNLRTVADNVAAAAADRADLVIFPEATMCRFGVPLTSVAESLDGPWASAVADLARQHEITVVAGMFTPDVMGGSEAGGGKTGGSEAGGGKTGGDRVRNTVLVATPDGQRQGYDKIHLYDAFGFRESDTVAAGTQPLTVEIPLADGSTATVGIVTCYDIRFPALFTELAARGAQVIAVPTSWGAGAGKLAQWQTLATARALDSATYIAAVGQAAPDDPQVIAAKAPTGIGHSQLTDPVGTVVAAYDETPQLAVYDVDLSTVPTARDQLGVLSNRRPIPRSE